MVDFTKYIKIKIDPTMPPDQVQVEQGGKVLATIINIGEEPLSIEALKANLHYYERLKMKAFEEHKAAIIKAQEAMTALNNALLRNAR